MTDKQLIVEQLHDYRECEQLEFEIAMFERILGRDHPEVQELRLRIERVRESTVRRLIALLIGDDPRPSHLVH